MVNNLVLNIVGDFVVFSKKCTIWDENIILGGGGEQN